MGRYVESEYEWWFYLSFSVIQDDVRDDRRQSKKEIVSISQS